MADHDFSVSERSDQRLSEQVLDRLREAIVRGRFAPGARLRERELTEWLEVSRTPVREALRKLVEAGLVEHYTRGGGYFVRNPSYEEAREAYEMRAILEKACCELAAQRATEVDIALMRQAVREASEVLESGDKATLLQRNKDFHRHLVRAAHNSFLEKQWETIWTFVDLLRGQWWADTERPAKGHHEHEELVEAIAARDVVLARSLGERHSRLAWVNIERRFEQS